MIRAVTIDFWGTLIIDPPSGDDRYKQKRLADFEGILRGEDVEVSRRALDRAYGEAGHRIGEIWRSHKDVPVQEHVVILLEAVDPKLPKRLGPGVM